MKLYSQAHRITGNGGYRTVGINGTAIQERDGRSLVDIRNPETEINESLTSYYISLMVLTEAQTSTTPITTSIT